MSRRSTMSRHLLTSLLLPLCATTAWAAYSTTITNYNSSGNQVIRFDVSGDAVDAHDGHLALFGGTYYLYGTSYNCGYQWNVAGSPFCGFKAYSSSDLVHWQDRGVLFDATTATWQTRCNGSTYGCYRPHVIYNAGTGLYVLWINSYDNSVGFHVFTSAQPVGPFTQVADPTLAVNSSAPVAGLNNGDHDAFVDDDGTAYLAYTDWRTGGGIVVERLNASYQSGTGSYVRVTSASTEAPALFKRSGIYYLTYSDPNCGYCSGTGTSYRTASSPLGAWSAGASISANSCGGQPSFVKPIPLTSGTAYIYGSDLWNNGAANEALANYYWAPLTFSGSAISPMVCQNSVALSLSSGSAGSQLPVANLDQESGVAGFRSWADIGPMTRIQTFVPSRSGLLTSASLTTFQTGNPNAGLILDLVTADASYQPTGTALYTVTIPVSSIGWSPRSVSIYPNITVSAGVRYGIVARSTTTSGLYGWAFNDSAPYPGGGSAYKTTGSWVAEANRTLKFQTTVSSGPAGYTFCASENGTCSFAGTASVAFGANGLFNYGTYTNSVACNNATFGDPAPGTLKACYYKITAATPTVTASPTPTLAPTATPGGTAVPIVSGNTYTLASQNSGKCVDAATSGTANGTWVQQYTCNASAAQQWVFTATDSGYYQVATKNAAGQVWDVSGGSSATADGVIVQLWTYGGGTNQQWQPIAASGPYYKFVARHSGKCLDVPNASTADSVQLQQWVCNGTGAQSYSLNLVSGPSPTSTATRTATPTATPTATTRATATATAGTGTTVSLSSAFNVNVAYSDGTTFPSTGGADAVGSAYSSTLLGASVSWSSASFSFGAANVLNGVRNKTVTLPAGQFGALLLLGTGVNGDQLSQTVKVNYNDGTSSTFTQTFSNWLNANQAVTGQSIAKQMAYRNKSTGVKDNRVFNLYGYSFALDNTRVVSTLVLPANNNVSLLAATLR